MTRQALEQSFLRIREDASSGKEAQLFVLSESLETDLDQKERGRGSRAYLSDYMRLLETLPVPERIRVLRYSLSHSGAKHLGEYCLKLAETKDPESLIDIIALAHTEEGKHREYSATALQYYDNPKAIAALTDLLLNDDSPRVRFLAAGSLGIIGNGSAGPFLLEALKDDEGARFLGEWNPEGSRVSTKAAWALNRIAGKEWSLREWRNARCEWIFQR